MLFRELTFKDFLVFKGENRIVFPPPAANKSSLILVLAPNHGGKTSVIRALEFLFYGRLRREMPDSSHLLINTNLYRAIKPGTTVEGWVQAKIEIDGHTRTIRRRVEATRTGAASFRTRIFLEETVQTARGDRFDEDQGTIQRTLERLVPESLFDYFYFQGETLAQQLIQGNGNEAIHEGLAALLHQDKWEEAIATVDQVRRRLSSELQNLAAAKRTLEVDLNSGLLTLLNQLERNTRSNFHSRLASLQKEAEELLRERDDNIVAQHDISEAIKDLEAKRAKSNIEAIVEQQAKQRKAADSMKAARGKQEELKMQLRNLEFREKQVKRELDEMGRRGAGPQLQKLHAMRERANELQNLIEKSLSQLKSSFHTMLQRSVRKYYDNNVSDGSKAIIDPKTLLPSIRKNGELLLALGGGQRQMLALAHIISLAELRRDLHAELDELGIKTGKLDDQSFFLDSIFAPCDRVYARIFMIDTWRALPLRGTDSAMNSGPIVWRRRACQGYYGSVA
jgi:hypothetical protein